MPMNKYSYGSMKKKGSKKSAKKTMKMKGRNKK